MRRRPLSLVIALLPLALPAQGTLPTADQQVAAAVLPLPKAHIMISGTMSP